VPRADTETLVDAVLHHLDAAPRSTVLDVGTGSGAIALAVKQQRPGVRVTAVDCDAAALRIAAANASRLGLDVRCLESNWFSAAVGERFDLIVSNPPYVRSDDPHFAGSLRFEPRLALDGGRDGLEAYRAIFARAGQHLEPAGLLLVEHGYDQRASVLELGVENGFAPVALLDDLSGVPRVAVLEAPRT
jgi:release factor glutamine methyltransferase